MTKTDCFHQKNRMQTMHWMKCPLAKKKKNTNDKKRETVDNFLWQRGKAFFSAEIAAFGFVKELQLK